MANFWTAALGKLVKLKSNPIALSVTVRSPFCFLLETSPYLNVLRVFQSELIDLQPQLLILPIELVLVSLLSIDCNIKVSDFLSKLPLNYLWLLNLLSKLLILSLQISELVCQNRHLKVIISFLSLNPVILFSNLPHPFQVQGKSFHFFKFSFHTNVVLINLWYFPVHLLNNIT